MLPSDFGNNRIFRHAWILYYYCTISVACIIVACSLRCRGRNSSVRYCASNETLCMTNEKRSAPTERLATTTRTGHDNGIWYVAFLFFDTYLAMDSWWDIETAYDASHLTFVIAVFDTSPIKRPHHYNVWSCELSLFAVVDFEIKLFSIILHIHLINVKMTFNINWQLSDR